ncbi:PEP-CTERM sorting domain-containing protein [Planctomycetota bacterium]|nr:PEP-CTERM sorting domain-containing protein [Planctomycetota bacterium]
MNFAKTTLLGAACAFGMASVSTAELVVDFDGGSDDATITASFPLNTFSSPGDGWGVYVNDTSSTPWSLLDESADNASDKVGIYDSSKADAFFGVVDTVNNDISDEVSVTFDFDVSAMAGADLDVTIEMGAMGDFEASSDLLNWTYSVDDGAAQELFAITIDEEATHTYAMEAITYDWNDPAFIGDTMLTNVVQDFTKSVTVAPGATSLKLTLTAKLNGGEEAYAFDNIRVAAIPEPASLALLGLGGLAMLRRRK